MTDETTAFIKKLDMIAPGQGVVCAVSGGMDSVCLLDVLFNLKDALGFRLYACHFNHKLRGAESEGDEAFVRTLCGNYQVPLFVGTGDVTGEAKRSGRGIEETARALRYAFFEQALKHFGADKLATAHNADDNLETVLLHLARGTGLRGLCGIPPVRGPFVRPILFAPRSRIEAYCLGCGLPHVEDATNSDLRYARNRVRSQVLPVLRDLNPEAAGACVDMCLRLREDENYLTGLSYRPEGDIEIKKLGEKPLGIRTLRDSYERVSGGGALSAAQLDALWALCQSRDPSASLDLPGGIAARREYEKLKFLPGEEKNEEFSIPLPLEGAVQAGNFLIFCKISNELPQFTNFWNTFALKRDMIDGALCVRSRRTGDYLKLPGRPGKSLKKLFIDEKLPLRSRDKIPVIADGSGVLAVYGFGADERRMAKADDEVLLVTVEPVG